MAKKVAATKTLRARLVLDGQAGTLLASGSKMRFEGSGAEMISDAEAGREIMLDSDAKLAYHIPPTLQFALADLYGLTRKKAEAATAPIEDYANAAGQRFPGHQGEIALAVGGGKVWKVQARVWSDPRTKLPVRVEIRPLTSDGKTSESLLLENLEFDVELDNSLFDTSVPPGYTLAGASPDQLRPAPGKEEAEQLVLTPGVGLGAIRFGMSKDQITAILGPPEFILHDVYLGYPSKGLQLIQVHAQVDELQMIIANPWDAASLVKNDFPGRTDKGIRIGSTEQDVRAAYGEPDPPPREQVQRNAPHMIGYRRLGLSFGFTDGKVNQIILSR